MSIEEKISQYKKTLDLFPNPQEKYQYLIEQAKKSEEFPVELRVDEFKVNGCQSQVWLVPEEKDNKLFFKNLIGTRNIFNKIFNIINSFF